MPTVGDIFDDIPDALHYLPFLNFGPQHGQPMVGCQTNTSKVAYSPGVTVYSEYLSAHNVKVPVALLDPCDLRLTSITNLVVLILNGQSRC